MATVKFNYRDGTSETIAGVLKNSVVTFGDGEGAFAMEGVMVDYRLTNIKDFEVLEAS